MNCWCHGESSLRKWNEMPLKRLRLLGTSCLLFILRSAKRRCLGRSLQLEATVIQCTEYLEVRVRVRA